MKKILTEKNLAKDRHSNIFMTLVITLVVCLSVAKVIVANRLVDTSEKLRNLDRQIATAEDKNQVITESLRIPMSIVRIEDQAKALGFVKAGNFVFLSPAINVAMR